MSYVPQRPSPSDEMLALLPDEDTVRGLLLRIRQEAYMEGAAATVGVGARAAEAAYRDGLRAGVERDSATTFGAGYDSGYQDGVRATRQAGP